MKAYQLHRTGFEEPLRLIETAIPQPSENRVLIKIKSFSVNPVDIKTRKGKSMYEKLKTEMPLILGWDVSGEVVAVGGDVKNLNVGDEVFGMINFPGHGRAYAEYVTAPEDHLAVKPATISHQEAAASTLAALTAYQVLVKYVTSGDRVLIHAAAGGVGHFAVQIAKILGAYVIGTCSTKNIDFVTALGADEVIDYTQTDFADAVSDIDFVLDSIAGDVLLRSTKVLKKGGSIISLPSGSQTEAKEIGKQKNIFIDFQLVESSGKDMRQIAEWLASKALRPHIFRNYAFDDIELAHQQIMTGRTRGKIVVSI